MSYMDGVRISYIVRSRTGVSPSCSSLTSHVTAAKANAARIVFGERVIVRLRNNVVRCDGAFVRLPHSRAGSSQKRSDTVGEFETALEFNSKGATGEVLSCPKEPHSHITAIRQQYPFVFDTRRHAFQTAHGDRSRHQGQRRRMPSPRLP